MARSRIGLDIGSTGVRAAEISMRSSPPKLLRVGQVALAPGAMANGEIREPAAVAEAIRELWRRVKFGSREVILGVANQRVVVREVVLPWLEEKELRESLAFQVQEYVPIPLDEAVLDYSVVEDFEREDRRMLRILVVAATKVMIQQLVQAVEMAKLRPIGLDLIPFAILRSVGSVEGVGLEEAPSGDEAIVDIGGDMTSICVHAMGLPRFVRILPTAGNDITNAVAKGLAIDQAEAERLKKGSGNGETDLAQDAAQAARSMAGSFADEVRSSLDFYESQTAGATVSRMLVTGGGSKLEGLLDMLGQRISADVMPGHAFRRVTPTLDLSDEALGEVEPLLAVAVGLALPGARA